MTSAKPSSKPANSNFSSGPCSKRPGWNINLLHYYLLEPILGIGDARYDNRIDFIAGYHGLESIEKKVNSGEAKIGFSLFATQMEDVISFADKKLTMPPKSTWFDPKPLDGLVAYDFE